MPIYLERKLTKVGNSLRVVIPKEIVDILKLKAGDTLRMIMDNSRIIVEKAEKK